MDVWAVVLNVAGDDVRRSRAPPGVDRDRGGAVTADACRLFSPFPRQYVNRRRVDHAIRLGLYAADDTTTAGPQRATTSGHRSSRYS